MCDLYTQLCRIMPMRKAAAIAAELESCGAYCTHDLRGMHVPAFYATDQANTPSRVVDKLGSLLSRHGASLVR